MNLYLSKPGDKRVLLDPAAFTIPAPGERFPIRDKHSFEFRAEIYNVLNHANFANPVARLNNALGTGGNQLQPGQPFTAAAAGGTFGMATSTLTKDVGLGAGRQIQLLLGYSF